ncbi:MAG: hypothetical protein CL677_09270 [Bdellovibrionaceae bacterium]|nr:hypothetical protein [Pseudobdellovibrionaceae bacterium]|tara:strand:+ start:115 stop:492 length:378 start_codon:yes stop_codon:yes gene_type:complete
MSEMIGKRRRVPRRDYQKRIGVLYSGTYLFADALQIGEGGMLFASSDVFQKGQMLVVSFHIPGYQHAIARAVIRYAVEDEEQPGNMKYGVEFENIDFDSKRYIRYYVASDRQPIGKENPTLAGVG